MQAPRVLRYAESSTHVGRVLILMSRHGVVDIVFAEPGVASCDLLHEAQSRFPSTVLVPDAEQHPVWVSAAVSRINGAHARLVAPIDCALLSACSPREIASAVAS